MRLSGGMDQLKDSAEENSEQQTGQKTAGGERETSGRRDDVEMGQGGRLRTYVASNGQPCEEERLSLSASPEELFLESTSPLHKTQTSNPEHEENQPKVSSKPSLSFTALIAKAILSSPSRELNLSTIYSYIEENFPYFRSRHQGWKNSIRHNLSLNDCFVKLGRCEDGKGHYWGIHPAHMADFLRGDFRQHRKANRSRQRRAFQNMAESHSWVAQCHHPEYWSYCTVAGGSGGVGYPWQIAHPWHNALLAGWMFYPHPLCFNGPQSFRGPEAPLNRVVGLNPPFNCQFKMDYSLAHLHIAEQRMIKVDFINKEGIFASRRA